MITLRGVNSVKLNSTITKVAIEPWVQEKAAEYEAQGYPGKATFNRLYELAKQNGAKPVHDYSIK